MSKAFVARIIDRKLTFYSKIAPDYTSRHSQQEFGDFINKMHAFILANVSWIGVDFLDPASTFETASDTDTAKTVRVLDYACGPGTVTNILTGHASEFIGIDLSSNMVKEYNQRFSSQEDGAQKINAQAYNDDLLDPKGTPSSLDDPKFFNFDLAVVSGGFHHFDDPGLATKRLTERLKPGGVFMILDFLTHAKEDWHNDEVINTVVHHGFSEAQVRKLFSDAGLEDIQMRVMDEDMVFKGGKARRRGFLARGRKPSA